MKYKVGMKFKDSESNEFTITEIRPAKDNFQCDDIVLKGCAGEKEIISNDLKFMTLIGK